MPRFELGTLIWIAARARIALMLEWAVPYGGRPILVAPRTRPPMPTVLPDCCEDWILQFGAFYGAGEAFACPECGSGWEKTARDRFQRPDEHRGRTKDFRL